MNLLWKHFEYFAEQFHNNNHCETQRKGEQISDEKVALAIHTWKNSISDKCNSVQFLQLYLNIILNFSF